MKTFITHLFPLFFAAMLSDAARATTIYYVKPGGTGAGTSWANAMGVTQLQAAINAVSTAGGGQVWVAAGTYYPQAQPAGSTAASNRDYAFTLANGVAVYGGFAGTETLLSQRNYTGNVTILSGDINTSGTYTDDCYHVVVSISNNGTAILDGFTIGYGYANGGTSTITYSGVQIARNYGGGLFVENSQPAISNCTFVSNTGSSGGGVYNYNTSVGPVFTGCGFSNNAAITTATPDGGGAICNANNTFITLTSCSFSGNTSASDGGGIFSNNSCTMTLSGCVFSNNTAAGSGGGFVNESSSVATLTSCSFTGNKANSATYGGGGVCNYSTNGFSATGCTFSNNTAAYSGGGIYFTSGSSQSTMANCSFSSNSAVYGGGIAAGNGSNQTVTTTTFSSNASTYGGGVYNNGSSYTYTYCTFQSNSASAATGKAGGGECNDNSANGSMLHCLFLNNTSMGDGAGQYNNSSNAIDSECVFNGNVSQGNGGGMVDNGANPKAWNCVLSDNIAAGYGGGFYSIGASATFENCTVYNNSANSAGGYGDGIYVASGSPKIYNDIVWSGSNSSSVGLVYAGGVTPKVQYSDTQGALFTGTGNISTVPSFVNAGSYIGADGVWATADDGLHLANGSAGTNAIPTASATAYDITMTNRPVPGPQSDMGAYEGPGSYVTLAIQPVDISAAGAGGSCVDVDWMVSPDVLATGFMVERSMDGGAFDSVGYCPVTSGRERYRFFDSKAMSGANFYRIRTMLADGSVWLSSTVVVRLGTADDDLSVRSAGDAGPVLLFMKSSLPETVLLKVVDAGGRSCWAGAAVVSRGDNYISLPLPALTGGVYFLVVSREYGQRITKAFRR